MRLSKAGPSKPRFPLSYKTVPHLGIGIGIGIIDHRQEASAPSAFSQTRHDADDGGRIQVPASYVSHAYISNSSALSVARAALIDGSIQFDLMLSTPVSLNSML